MAPLLEETIETSRRLGAAFKRSRSLSSLDIGEFDDSPTKIVADEQLVDPFAEDLAEFGNVRRNPLWFNDMKGQRQGKFVTSHSRPDPSSQVQFDCFGFSLFDLEADDQLFVEQGAPVEAPKPVQNPEEAEKIARRARRRRSSRSTHHSGRGVPPSGCVTRRRSIGGGGIMDASALAVQAFISCQHKESGPKMRRSRTTGDDGGMSKRKQEQPGNKTGRWRSKSVGDGGISSLSLLQKSHHTKSRKRNSGSSRQKRGDSDLSMMLLMDQSSPANLESHQETSAILLETGQLDSSSSSKSRRRSGSKRRALKKLYTHPSNKSSRSVKVTDHRRREVERRRGRRSETSGVTSSASTRKKVVRARSLTSLTSLTSSPSYVKLVSTPNLPF